MNKAQKIIVTIGIAFFWFLIIQTVFANSYSYLPTLIGAVIAFYLIYKVWGDKK